MSNIISYLTCFGILPWLLAGLIGAVIGCLICRGKKQLGDLSIEGEGQLRAENDSLRARIGDLEASLKAKDGEIGDLKANLTAAPAEAEADDDETYALEWRNRYLAARVKYLEGRISDTPKPKAKKAAPKKKATPKKKAAPKKNMSIIARGTGADAMDAYYANVKKYDRSAKRADVEKMARYCGVALNSRDSSLVACSQEHELETIAKGYCAKKLGMGKDDAMAAIKDVCKKMKGERFKSRVTFYYLLEKAASKKKPAKKPAAKKAAPKKAAPKKKLAAKPAGPNAKWLEDVRKYDKSASAKTVDNIVKYCGIALKTRDGSLVACSQEHELETIAKGFATKKLGLKSGQMELVKDTCKKMAKSRFKNRVTFYYLMAKKAGKLGMFK